MSTTLEEEVLVAKLTIKTLTDKAVKLDYTDSSLTLAQLKVLLVERVELPVEKQFFVLNGVVYGQDGASDTLQIANLPGFNSPEAIVAEYRAYEEQKKKSQEEGEKKEEAGEAAAISIVKGIEDLLPVLYLFHYEPVAKAVDPLEIATDWDQKNRLKFFKGILALAERRLDEAAKYLVEALPTFEETGFMPYKELVKYAVISAAVAFDRPTLKGKVRKIAFCVHEN
jgi:hypothetical protein